MTSSNFINSKNIDYYLEKNCKFLCITNDWKSYTKNHIVNSIFFSYNSLVQSEYSFLYNYAENTLLPTLNVNNNNIILLLKYAGLNINDYICVYPHDDNYITDALFFYRVIYSFGFKNIYYLNELWTKLPNYYFTQTYPEWNYVESSYNYIDDSISANDIALQNANNDLKLIDARSELDFNGVTNLFKVNGHIPNSKNVFWKDLFIHINDKITPTFKSKEEIYKIITEKTGFNSSDTIALTCNNGKELSVLYFALKFILNWNNIQPFNGSWNLYQLLYQRNPSLFPIVSPPKKYDYIIVGAGAAGSVLAARLSEDPNITVLLLETGHDNSTTSKVISEYDKSLILVPANFPLLYKRYHDTPALSEASPILSDFSTIKEFDSRYYSYARGNGAGGSANHHAMIDGRGSPLIYDGIAKMLNDPIWSYNNILQYYKKMETYNIPTDHPEIHGYDGWLKIRRTGELNQDLRSNVITALNKSLGIPYTEDPNVPENVSSVYIAQQQVTQDVERSYSYKDLLQPVLEQRKNVTVQFNTLIEKIIVDNEDNKLVTKGVVAYIKPYLADVNITGNIINPDGTATLPNKDLPQSTNYYAKKEVILCAGAISSPQILMLSGIGPKDELSKFGIPCVLDLPGVGKNLIDHIEANIGFQLDPTKIMWEWQATYMKNNTDYKKLATPAIQKSIEKYNNPNYYGNDISLMFEWDSGKDPVFNPLEPDSHTHVINAFWFDFNFDFKPFPIGDNFDRIQHEKDSYLPDVNRAYTPNGIPGLKTYYFNNQLNPENPIVILSFLTECLRVAETGSITLKDSNPVTSPIINLGLCYNDDAIERVARMIFKIRESMQSSLIKDYALDQNNYEIYPGTACDTLEKMMLYIKNWQSYGHHMAGTCKMGLKSDSMSVLDSRLKVHGIFGLRVIDMSLYPSPFLHAYNPSRGIYMIAEMMSDIIKSEHK